MANNTSIQRIIHENSAEVSKDVLRFDYNSDDSSIVALADYINGLTQNCDVFFHNFDLSGDTQVFQRVESIFDKGLMMSSGSSFLSTMFFVENKKDRTGEVKSIFERLENYRWLGNHTIIVAIPKKFRDIYFGSLSSKNKSRDGWDSGATGRQNKRAISLDYLGLKALPSEFIIGAFCREDAFCGKFYVNKNFLLNELSDPDKSYASIKQKLGFETNRYRWLFDLNMSDKESADRFAAHIRGMKRHHLVNDYDGLERLYEDRLAESGSYQKTLNPTSSQFGE